MTPMMLLGFLQARFPWLPLLPTINALLSQVRSPAPSPPESRPKLPRRRSSPKASEPAR